MDKNNKLSQFEEKAIFEQVWKEYTKPKKNILYPLILLAALIILSFSFITFSDSSKNTQDIYAQIPEELSEVWAVEDEIVSIYDVEISEKDLENILAGL